MTLALGAEDAFLLLVLGVLGRDGRVEVDLVDDAAAVELPTFALLVPLHQLLRDLLDGSLFVQADDLRDVGAGGQDWVRVAMQERGLLGQTRLLLLVSW